MLVKSKVYLTIFIDLVQALSNLGSCEMSPNSGQKIKKSKNQKIKKSIEI
jgi:hypothetical protein